jgi:quinol-cytochrome oxidoreductase complex cytochrome b subunit
MNTQAAALAFAGSMAIFYFLDWLDSKPVRHRHKVATSLIAAVIAYTFV